MDAVEMPLPANVVVSKILAADGFGRAVEPEATDADGGEGSVFVSSKASGCNPFRNDVKHQLPHLECISVSRGKKFGSEFRMPENKPPRFKSEGNGKRHYLGEADMRLLSLHKCEGKSSNRKIVKSPSDFPCSKRSRTDQPENFARNFEANEHDILPMTTGSDISRGTSSERSRMVKQKRSQDGKRTDKKNCRATVKTRYDSFTSKAALAGCDTASGGNNILGIYGLKLDIHDVTKHMDELSLSELLDGSYKYPNTCSDKGKRASNVNDNILASVKKAASILPTRGMVGNNGNRRSLVCLINPYSSSVNVSDCDSKDKGIDEPVSYKMDPCEANSSESSIYQPKEILERLALPPAQDLDNILSDFSLTSVPSQSAMHMTTTRSVSLPPFSWSYSHSGPCKPSVDTSKLASSRNTCQGKWVRIGSNSTSTGDDHNCFLEMELKSLYQDEDPPIQPKINDQLQDVKTVTESGKPPYGAPSSRLYSVSTPLEAPVSDNIYSRKDTEIFDSYISKKLNLVDGHAYSLDSHLEFDYKDNVPFRTSESEVSLRVEGFDANLADLSKSGSQVEDNEVGKKEHYPGNRSHCSDNTCCYSSKTANGGCDQSLQYLPTSAVTKPGDSPRALHAAEILCEMQRCSDAIKNQSHNSGRMKWPKMLSQKTMKARKSMSFIDKTDGLFTTSRHQGSMRSTGLPSIRDKSISEKRTDFAHTNDIGCGPIWWSVPPEGRASPGKLERDPTINPRTLRLNSVRSLSLMAPPARVERGCDIQQKLGKATPAASSVPFGGSSNKDTEQGKEQDRVM